MNDIQLTLDSGCLYELEDELVEKDGIVIQFVTLEGKTEILNRIEPVDKFSERGPDEVLVDFDDAIECLLDNLSSVKLLSPDEYCRYFLSKEKVRRPKDTIAKIVVANLEYFIFVNKGEYYISTDGFVFFSLPSFFDLYSKSRKLAVMMFDKNMNLIHFGEDIQFADGFELLLRELESEGIIRVPDGKINVEFDYGFTLESKKNLTVVNFSCLCLAQLIFSLKTHEDVINAILEIQKCLIDGRIEIIDSVPEHTLKVKDKSKVPLGYVKSLYSDDEYHRAGTVLIRDNETQIFYILGQDEDQYFGCELPSRNVNTVEEAFLDLIPEAFRDYSPSSYQRQGEWFVLNIESEKPKNNKIDPEFEKFLKLNISVLGEDFCDEESCNISYTREGWTEVGFKKLRTGLSIVDCSLFDLENKDPNSRSSHFVCSESPFVCAFSRSIIKKDNYYLVKFFTEYGANDLALCHSESEHEEILLKYNTCYAICENRAVQSASMRGVD